MKIERSVLTKVCGKGTIFQWKVYERGTPVQNFDDRPSLPPLPPEQKVFRVKTGFGLTRQTEQLGIASSSGPTV